MLFYFWLLCIHIKDSIFFFPNMHALLLKFHISKPFSKLFSHVTSYTVGLHIITVACCLLSLSLSCRETLYTVYTVYISTNCEIMFNNNKIIITPLKAQIFHANTFSWLRGSSITAFNSQLSGRNLPLIH